LRGRSRADFLETKRTDIVHGTLFEAAAGCHLEVRTALDEIARRFRVTLVDRGLFFDRL
jgi:hypothetical protein